MIKKEKVQSCPNPIYCLQSHDVPFGTSDDLYCKQLFEAKFIMTAFPLLF